MLERLIIFGIILITYATLQGGIVNRGFRKIHLSRVLLYMSAVAMIGVLGEIFVDTIYRHFFKVSLWHYNFVPVHHAYTSKFAPVLWASVGLYIYLAHHKYEKWSKKELVSLSIIFGFEAMFMEAVVDLISKPILGNYIYYYNPSGLWHISAFQNFPFYFICGALIAQTLHWFKSSPHYFTILAAWVTTVTVYFQ
jgi:hypothetical protein